MKGRLTYLFDKIFSKLSKLIPKKNPPSSKFEIHIAYFHLATHLPLISAMYQACFSRKGEVFYVSGYN